MRAVTAVDYAYICVKLHSASLFLKYMLPAFKTGAFVRSAIPPKGTFYCITDFSSVQWEVGAEIRAFEYHGFGLHPFALG